MPRIVEAELDHAFADDLVAMPQLLPWLLSGGRFARFASTAKLLNREQSAIRPRAKHWWKHWWCRLPDASESETDIFIVLEAEGLRFALHIENKPAHGMLSMRQAADYRRRAAFKANDPMWLSYTDFECLLTCPSDFAETNATCASQFDRIVTYEEVAKRSPTFDAALLRATEGD